ncbi:MAG: enoyl-CoA hydratase/isomerase family protein [Anaerolineales bacterium]|nr:MAG: enoyl-CoA hydratase/isomerase family protein [Anaerolineales bacterium]
MTPFITYEIGPDQIGLLTLNRPSARNALNWDAMESFAAIVQQIKTEGKIRALILAGEGQAFCAGGDLFELHHTTSHADGERLAGLMGDALARLANLPIPVIASIEGPALGGGAEIALACDLRVMAQSARIGFPQITLALTPAWGGASRLLELVGFARAFAWLASGELFDSQKALESGLAHRIVPDGQALEAAHAMAETLIKADQAALRALKTVLRAHLALPAADATQLERALFADLWSAESHIMASSKFIDRQRDP